MINVYHRTPEGDIPAIPVGARISWYRWLIGRWRLLFKFCPECNSSAPHCDGCQVCHNNREAFYYWTPYIKSLWWNRYILQHTIYKGQNMQTDMTSEEFRMINAYEQM